MNKKNIKRKLIRGILMLLSIFPIKRNKIVFSSYHGTKYACNPRYISDYLLNNEKNLDIVWILPSGVKSPNGVRTIRETSLIGLYEIATAKIWIDNCRKSIWMRKRKNQYYIQTWHCGIGLKISEGDAEDKLPQEYVEAAINDSMMADLFLSGSKWLSELYRKSFWYSGEILELGLPREDILHECHNLYHKSICDYYEVDYNTHFLLYAPTFRNSGDLDAYNIDYGRLLNFLNRNGEKWKIILRLHPNIYRSYNQLTFNGDILNGSTYDEINNLIMASSIFISDYSSCMFDAMIAGLKVFLYASDIEFYNKERGFLFDWDELPFDMAKNNDELLDLLDNFDENKYCSNVDKFINDCGIVMDGNATNKVCNKIMEIINS